MPTAVVIAGSTTQSTLALTRKTMSNKVTEINANIVGYIGSVKFAQNLFLSPNAFCCVEGCDWAQPWDGKAMLEHAVTHGFKLGDTCEDCVIETFKVGVPALCKKHYAERWGK